MATPQNTDPFNDLSGLPSRLTNIKGEGGFSLGAEKSTDTGPLKQSFAAAGMPGKAAQAGKLDQPANG